MKLRAALKAAEIQELPPDVEQRLREVLASREDDIARALADEFRIHKHLDKELLWALVMFGTDKIRAVALSAIFELSRGGTSFLEVR
jgi:predicted ArsR family transcriptional regulator